MTPLVQYSGTHPEVEHPFEPGEVLKRGGRIEVTGKQAKSLGAVPASSDKPSDWTLVEEHPKDSPDNQKEK